MTGCMAIVEAMFAGEEINTRETVAAALHARCRALECAHAHVR